MSRGHTGLDYVSIATGEIVTTQYSSLVNLANSQPTFVLAFNKPVGVDKLSCEKTVNILETVDLMTAEKIMVNTFKSEVESVTALHHCEQFTIGSVGIVCGTLMASPQNRNQLGPSIRDVAIEYDPSRKLLNCFCPAARLVQAEEAVKQVLQDWRSQIGSASTVFAYPHTYSPMRIQLGPGFVCKTVLLSNEFCEVDVRRLKDQPMVKVRDRLDMSTICAKENCSFIDDVEDEEIFGTFQFHSPVGAKAVFQEMSDNGVDVVPSYRHAMERQELVQCNNSSIVARAVWSARSINYRSLKKKKLTDSWREGIHLGVERLLTSHGLRLADSNSTTLPSVETSLDKEHVDCVNVNITFPFYHCARVGIEALASYAESNAHCFALCNEEALNEFVRTYSVSVDDNVYNTVRQPLRKRIENLLNVDKLLSGYEITSKNRCQCMELITTKVYYITQVKDAVDSFIQPLLMKIKRSQTTYLNSREGERFVKFLSQLLNIHVHRPEYLQEIRIYGVQGKKELAAKQLLEQSTASASVEANELITRWHLVDFSNSMFCVNATSRWINEMEKDATKLKAKGELEDWVIDVENMHLWVRANSIRYNKYLKDIESLKIVDPILEDQKEEAKQCVRASSKEKRQRKKQRRVAVKQSEEVKQKDLESLRCFICWVNFTSDADPLRCVMEVCGHAYCQSCFTRTVTMAINENKLPALCQCSTPFSLVDLRHACSLSQKCDVIKLVQCSLRDYLFTSADYEICPRANCPGVLASCITSHQNHEKHQLTCLICPIQVNTIRTVLIY